MGERVAPPFFHLQTFVPMIIGEIRRYLRDNNPIRVSRSLRDTAYKALQARDALASRDGKEPTVDEIAQRMEVPRADVVQALDAIQDPVSLFEPIYHDGGDAIYVMDQVKDEKSLYAAARRHRHPDRARAHLQYQDLRLLVQPLSGLVRRRIP